MTTPAVNKPVAGTNQGETQAHDILPTLFGDGYGTYAVNRNSFVVSFLLNILFVAGFVGIGSYAYTHQDEVKQIITGQVIEISPYVLSQAEDQSGGGGGGGDRDKLASPKGALPKSARDQIVPPAVVVRNENPKLVVPPTVVAPEINLPQMANLGDPLSNVTGPASNGTGFGGGIGTGSGGGVGSGRGPGVGPGWGGGTGGGAYRVGGGVSAPRALYAPDPEYSEEARKAKYQGTVVLWVVVGPDGRPHDIRVQRSLGMGLDQKAMDAVRSWKFEPAKKDGQPVAVQINVEVNFRLY
ncbi:MAG TPA: energy transducer TonB [Clostridia bacterium]|nr:energy transducer TonB [Clostridia bacterium]